MNGELAKLLKNGAIGVLPTDTLYGIVASALVKKAVLRIYKLRKRNPAKPMIILIGSVSYLKLFNIKLDTQTIKILKKVWPGKVSVILPCRSKKFVYLHRGTKTLAFRLPKDKKLRMFLKKTGPLIAPSANWESFPPALNIKQAKKYFSDKVDFYVDAGIKRSLPSTLIEINKGQIRILRRGAVRL